MYLVKIKKTEYKGKEFLIAQCISNRYTS